MTGGLRVTTRVYNQELGSWQGFIVDISMKEDEAQIRVREPRMGGWSVVVEFHVFGAPRFSVKRSQNTSFKGFWRLWTENRGAPKTRESTTTDPTPHSRLSDLSLQASSERHFLEVRVFVCKYKYFLLRDRRDTSSHTHH